MNMEMSHSGNMCCYNCDAIVLFVSKFKQSVLVPLALKMHDNLTC